MAGAAEKKRAQRNTEILASLHKISISIAIVSLISITIFKRPGQCLPYFLFFNIPSMVCEYIVENIGRPTFEVNEDGYTVLVRAGDDLQQSGLTEYMFDIVYLSNLINLLMSLFGTMKVWYLILIVPVYACWKLKGLASTVLGFLLPNLRRNSNRPNDNGAGGAKSEETKSKRQAKLEKRAAKARGQMPARYR